MRVLILSLLLLSGCSSIYHPREGWVPEGYSEQRQAENQYSVRFESYRGEDWLKLEELLLYRAAELGKEKNHRYFLISNLQNKQKVEVTENQAINIAGYNGADSSASAKIPYTAFYHKVRTVDALISYISTPRENSYDVQQLLTNTTLD